MMWRWQQKIEKTKKGECRTQTVELAKRGRRGNTTAGESKRDDEVRENEPRAKVEQGSRGRGQGKVKAKRKYQENVGEGKKVRERGIQENNIETGSVVL